MRSSAGSSPAAPPGVAGRTSLAVMVSQIKAEIVNLNAAVATQRLLSRAVERCIPLSDLRQSIVIDTPGCGIERSVPAATLSCLQAVCNVANASIAAPGVAERMDAAVRAEKGDDKREKVDRSSPSPLPAKIPPDMLEKAELWARLERLDLLDRVASVRIQEYSAVSTRSSSLCPPVRDHERLDDRHAPPSEQDRARLASAGDVGVTMHQDKNREADDKPRGVERTESFESVLSSADTLIVRDAPDLDRCDSDMSSAATVIRGRFMLKATTGHKGVRGVCSVEHRMLTLSIAQQLAESNSPVLVEVPLEELAVGLQPGLANMFTIATFYENRMCDDDICCFAGDQAERDEWISIFRRMGVPVFDVSEGTGKAKELSL